MVLKMKLVGVEKGWRSTHAADGETVKRDVTTLTFRGADDDGVPNSTLEMTLDTPPALNIGDEILVGVTLEPAAAASPVPSPLPRTGDADPSAPAQADPPAPATISPPPVEPPTEPPTVEPPTAQ